MRKSLLFLFIPFVSIQAQGYSDYVNPLIGTDGHGHTYPGATMPYGMVQLSPDTRIDGSWDGCSGYHSTDAYVYGFSHTHLSGTGCSDYGDIMLMPVTKKPMAFKSKDYASIFDHTLEEARPGFYSTKLEDHQVSVNLTSTIRTGMHRYIFHENENAMVVLDLNHRDQLLDGEIEMIDDYTVAGYRYSKAWAQNQKIFFYIQFSRKIKSSPALDDSATVRGFKKISGKQLCANFHFDVNKNDTLLVKVGISGTSKEGAQLNLEKENAGWNFEATYQKAQSEWEKELGKIEINANNRKEYSVFYTALYHTMIVPNTWNDVDGKYRGMDDQIHTKTEGNYYTVFSLWDTFRAAHPLYTLIDQQRTRDYVMTFIQQFKEGGRLPVWELSSNETDCMIGIHSISVIADAVTKGLVDDQYKEVLAEAIISSANLLDYRGIGTMNTQHHLTIENESESVSKTLEYCYQYYCMAQVCKWAGKTEEAKKFEWISLGYKNLFNVDTGFFVPRFNGGWLANFDPTQVNNHFTEANAWQYAFFVPHDITGMIELYGGKEKFHDKLDQLFSADSKMTGREQADITGLIGQYAHGNEPSHHVAYLYNYVGDFRSTHKIVTKICSDFYSQDRNGLSGNEDCGQMSAWYVLSALGLYQVNPGSPNFTITIPQVLSAKIKLENGEVINISRDKGEINSVFWNGKKYEKLYIPFDELMKGGELAFKSLTGSKLTFASEIKEGDILMTSQIEKSTNYQPAPVIIANEPIFSKQTTVSIQSISSSNNILYWIVNRNGAKISKSKIKKYKKPFTVKNNCSISVYTYDPSSGIKSPTAISQLNKYPNNYFIDIKSLANPQYNSNGAAGLMDGVHGEVDWRKGNWHGYQGQDFEAIIDLQKSTKLNEVSCTFLQDLRSWILFPSQIEFWTSEDGINYTFLSGQSETPDDKNEKVYIKKLSCFPNGNKVRYLKVIAKNYGLLPKGHPGEGNPAFIFIDEIEFK